MDALPESHRGWNQQKEFSCGEQLLLLLDKGEASPGRRVNGRRQAPSRGPRVGVPVLQQGKTSDRCAAMVHSILP